jgi:hypothetical protein
MKNKTNRTIMKWNIKVGFDLSGLMNEKHLMNILNTSAKSLKNLKPKYQKKWQPSRETLI